MNSKITNTLSKSLFLLLILSFWYVSASSQVTTVTGVVRDASKATVPFANVTFVGTNITVSSDIQGRYKITAPGSYSQLRFSYVGFKALVVNISPGKDQNLDVVLIEDQTMLQDVVIKTKSKGYRNKDNPAVELIREVIDHREANRAKSYNYVEYNQYERIQFMLNNISQKVTDKKILQKYKFLFDGRDTTRDSTRFLMPVYMEEKSSKNYYRKDPEKRIQIINAKKAVDFSEYLDQDGMSMYLNRMYGDVDIYSGNIFIISNQFISPVAETAPTFYKYFITDTIQTSDNQKLIELSFVPRNKTDILFEGKMHITMDGNYGIQKVELGVNKNINLNWVRELHISQDFEKNPDGRYHVTKSKMMVDFGILKTKGPGVYGERTVTYQDYRVNQEQPDDLFKGEPVQTLPDAVNKPDQTWAQIRPDTLTASEARTYANIDSLKKIPSFKHTMNILLVLNADYRTYRTVDVGPVSSFYSFNPIEGLRFSFGGRTTPNFNKSLYFEGYGAYGFRDEKWKYLASTTYAFNHKSVYTFPQHYLRASYQHDMRIPGQSSHNNSFFTSFNRGANDKWLFESTTKLDYVQEFNNHFSYGFGVKNYKQQALGSLSFVTGTGTVIPDVTATELNANIRWAPKEKFFQGKTYRVTIPSKYPVISASYSVGINGLLGGQYDYQKLNLLLYKRFYMSQFGFTNVTLQGSQLIGQVPYPLLSIIQGNQSYSYLPGAYNMMNFIEFVSDHYASLILEHSFSGFFLNKVPLLKKAKLLEFLGFKFLSGGLRDENQPSLNPSLYKLPTTKSGTPLTYALGSVPYMEGSVGVGNIIRIFRVDYVRRFNYLSNPNAVKQGFRFGMTFDF